MQPIEQIQRECSVSKSQFNYWNHIDWTLPGTLVQWSAVWRAYTYALNLTVHLGCLLSSSLFTLHVQLGHSSVPVLTQPFKECMIMWMVWCLKGFLSVKGSTFHGLCLWIVCLESVIYTWRALCWSIILYFMLRFCKSHAANLNAIALQ